MAELRFYVSENDHSPFEEWFADLDVAAAARVSVSLARLEGGNVSAVKSVGAGVLELRIDWDPAIACISDKTGCRW